MDKSRTPHIAIDVETSGLSAIRGDRVIECAAVRVSNGDIVSEFSTLINASCTIHPEAVHVHGITKELLLNQPEPFYAWNTFLTFIGKAPLIAHNAQFDMGFIRHELARLGKHLPNRNICTLQMARRQFPKLPNHQLASVARHLLGVIPSNCRLHRALGDARLAAYVWIAMKGRE